MELLGLLLRGAVVFALLGVTLWLVRRVDRGRSPRRAAAPVQVLGTTRIGKGASVALVRIGGSTYALGVTEHAVSVLTAPGSGTEPLAVQAPVEPAPVRGPGLDFGAVLAAQLARLAPQRARPAARAGHAVEIAVRDAEESPVDVPVERRVRRGRHSSGAVSRALRAG